MAAPVRVRLWRAKGARRTVAACGHKLEFFYAKVRKATRVGATAQGWFRSSRIRSGGKYR